MTTCFLCQNMMVPDVPPTCHNTCLRRAFEAIQYAQHNDQPVNIANYHLRTFDRQKVCVIEERHNPEKPTISLTNSIEIAIVQICRRYGLCPALWTFVEHSNMGTEKPAHHEYDMIVLSGDDIQWKYLWHSDCKTESELYSDDLLIRRIEQYRSGADRV